MILDYIRAYLNILVILIVISTSVLYLLNKDNRKEESLECQAFYNADYQVNNQLFYWQENNLCCHYTIENDLIVEECL